MVLIIVMLYILMTNTRDTNGNVLVHQENIRKISVLNAFSPKLIEIEEVQMVLIIIVMLYILTTDTRDANGN